MNKNYKIVIVGGGTAGWMTAAALAKCFKSSQFDIVLIESSEIGAIGVGEATLPQIKGFNEMLGLSEIEMMAQTKATFKLGIKFVDWEKMGKSYFHPFGIYGQNSEAIEFHKLWFKSKSENVPIPDLESFSYAIALCQSNKFELPAEDHTEINSTHSYAYHFDASLYAQLLRKFSESLGVFRKEGKILQVNLNNDNGSVSKLTLESGEEISGDFFIDCSGMRSLLLSQTLKSDFEDWSKWLVCNRAVALPSERATTLTPYTTSTAKSGGWQWKIPLQHRTGNGYVYSSAFLTDQAAIDTLINDIGGAVITDPKVIQFTSGRFKKSWQKNCLAIGLSSGFLEPLESTSIYLIQVAILAFIKLFRADKALDASAKEFNRIMDMEYERIRDFLILHYHVNERNDSELWNYCRNMPVPDSLMEKIESYKKCGHIETYRYGLFNYASWLSVLHGQGVNQLRKDVFFEHLDVQRIANKLVDIRASIMASCDKAIDHEAFIQHLMHERNK